MPAVSVIIPVFKVSKFIRRCAESLMNQTLKDVEYIFVDDASPDDSISIVEEVLSSFPSRSGQVRIITHPSNKGLAGARNTGLAHATGDYVYHCDSDDWVEIDILEKMYCAAKQNDADVVYCDFYISFENNERYLGNPDYSNAKDMLLYGFLGGKSKYNVWNKLVRRSIYNDNGISFPEGYNMGEDMTMIQVFGCSNKVVHVPEALYHYVKLNTGAYSNTFSEKHLRDIKYNTERTIIFLKNHCLYSVDKYLEYFKLNIKMPFLISGDKSSYSLWREWFPEANPYILSNRNMSFRMRLVQYAAFKNQFWFVKLHYILIFKLVYGVIYR